MAPLHFWFDFASSYSYVASQRIDALCASAGVEVVRRPFLLGPIFEGLLGIKDSPFNTQPIRGRYMWRDLERLCAKHGIPWKRPSLFPQRSILAARVALATEGHACAAAFVPAAFRANFAEGRDLADPASLQSILTALGAGARALLSDAESPAIKQRLRDQTAEAARLGIFGAPNFVIGDELFFGQDRLEDAIDWAAKR